MNQTINIKNTRYSRAGITDAARLALRSSLDEAGSTLNTLRVRRAFTIVELMVVVAIIAVLLMLLIPNIRAMREKAWTSHCQNNLRQYGISMNQYMIDWNGDFIYAGPGGASASDATMPGHETRKGPIDMSKFTGGISGYGGLAGSSAHGWQNMVDLLPDPVTIQSLNAGKASLRVCPVIMQMIQKEGNLFDPDAPNFKGIREVFEYDETWEEPDFTGRGSVPSSDDSGNLLLDSAFTTYAINPLYIHKNKRVIPQHAVAFIDWNAKEGWWAGLYNTTAKFLFTSPDGSIVQDVTPKWTNAWWITEVGFHHLAANNEYGANYVAMDGHVDWVSSNAISITNFTGQ